MSDPNRPQDIHLKRAGVRPLPLRWFNFFAAPITLRADDILKAAFKAERSDDLGEDWNEEALQVLVEAINSEAQLSALGSRIVKKRLIDSIRGRLRAQQWFVRHPEILTASLPDPWVITGIQRTGTTYLQRLVAVDPDMRTPLSWESINPTPLKERTEVQERIKQARRNERGLRWMAPGFFAIHPIDHQRPEEDVLLLDQTLYTTAHEATMHVPTFSKWLASQDHRPSYRWERKLLLLLHWQRPGRRWLLKSPHHLEHLEALTSVFPDSKIIWTHRNPIDAIPSFLSMLYHSRAIFSTKVNVESVVADWLPKIQLMTQRALQYRRTSAPMRDVMYDDLVNRPLETVQAIYESLEVEFANPKEVQHEIKNHRKDRFGRHKYALQDFNLTAETVEANLTDYFNLWRQLKQNDRA